MRIIQAISEVDALKANTCSMDQKIQWLSRAEGMVKRLIIDRHEGAETVEFNGYNGDTDTGTVLLVPGPFDELYIRYLEAMIDLTNGEIVRYNNSMDLFNTAFTAYKSYYTRTHMPVRTEMRFF